MSYDSTDNLLDDLVDEIGIEVDRVRAAEADAEDVRYLTGIEVATGLAGWIAVSFVRGFIKGVDEEAKKAGVHPEALGERAGRWTFRRILDGAEQLGRRTRQILSGSHLEPNEESELGGQIEELLGELDPGGELPDDVRRTALGAARAEVVEELRKNGFDAMLADDLADRLANRLESASATADP
jgi:hypothetical protein